MDPALRDRLLDAAHRRAQFLEQCLRPGAPARVVLEHTMGFDRKHSAA